MKEEVEESAIRQRIIYELNFINKGYKMLSLRPHHILDIVRNIGNDRPIMPHEYGHLVHEITRQIISNIDTKCKLTISNDDICGPCRMLTIKKECVDVLHQLDPPISKQVYNDELDRKIMTFLSLEQNTVLTIRQYLVKIKNSMDSIVDICTHPKEDKESRRTGLIKGMEKLGIE